MPGATQSPRLIRFESFEVNLCSAELFCKGEKIRLPEQSFQILTMLLETPGDVVMRQDIQKRLWPHDTVVEFENSINAAIKRLRVALGDSADQPRYIETLARRGYRWIVPVERVEVNRIESPVGPPAEFVPKQSAAASLLGRRVSHYRVLEIVGGGGMGVVYKAEDLKLGRRVALKFLPEELANDAIAMERFGREARAASALNHPNICTIYEVEEHDGQPFIVMELLEGRTLRELISSQQSLPDRASEKRPVEFKTLLSVAVQIVEGLEAAHKQGIIHRDIKPANIFITTSGQAKILDFGLAKLQEPDVVDVRSAVAGADETHRSMGADLTLAGVAMGTVAYMSPEQVRGERLDARTDLFSFGLVLYEMATGQRAFSGDTAPLLHESILKRSPVPSRALNPELPSRLERIMDRALQKDREVRYQSATEILADLKPLEQSGRSALAWATSVRSSTPVRSSRKYWLLALGGAVVAGIVSLVIGYYLHRRQAVRLTEKDSIVLGDFSNSTGDPIFDDTLKQALSIALQQSPFLNILPDRRVRATLKLMTKPPNTPLNPEVVREVCQRSASKAYVVGAIATLGNEYVLGLKGVNCQTGDMLAQQQATVDSKDKVMDALGDSAVKLRSQLGESLATVGKFDVPLKQATTPSLEALKAYSLGNKAGFQKGPTAALPYHLRAIQLDPNFAMAYLNAGVGYYILGEIGRSTEYYSRAFQLREHASERERLLISSMYYYTVTGELDRAAEAYEEIIHNYPREVAAYGWLGLVYAQEGQYDKAVETALRVLPQAGDNLGEYEALSRYYLALQRFDQAHRMLEEAESRKLESGSLHTVGYALGFIEEDSRATEGHAAWFQGKRGDEDSGLSLQSDTAAYRGSLRKSRELTKRATEAALRDDSKENAAMYAANAAVREAEFGNAAQARQAAAEALKIAPRSQGVEIESALAFAVAGDTVRAESLVQDLGRRFPLNTQLQSIWLPTINAELALQKNHPTAAINQLHLAGSMELGYTPIAGSISCLYAAYERGRAYLAAGDGSAAAGEFQKIIDHTGMVWNCPTGALAHLGLARANALQARTDQGAAGDAARARASAAYSDFFALWRDADPDIPELKQAKAEYASLQ